VSTRWPRSASARCARTIRSLLTELGGTCCKSQHTHLTVGESCRIGMGRLIGRKQRLQRAEWLIVAAVGHAGVVASRNRPSSPVARNWEMGYEFFKGEVNAFDRLQWFSIRTPGVAEPNRVRATLTRQVFRSNRQIPSMKAR